MIAEAQRIEHYEIAVSGTTVRYAKQLALHGIAETLNETLNEEYSADDTLTDLVEERVNKKAIS